MPNFNFVAYRPLLEERRPWAADLHPPPKICVWRPLCFLLGVTAEALHAKIDQKSAISLQHGQFDPKFHVEADHFSRLVRQMNALQLFR